MFSAERNPAILLFVRTRAKSRAMTATLHAPGVQRIGRWATGARRVAGRRCARLCSRRLDAVGAGSTDASSVATLETRPEKPVAGRPDVAVARNICRKILKTLIQRPGPLPRHDPGSSPVMSKDASARTERPHPPIVFQHPGLTLLHSHISNRGADPLLQLCSTVCTHLVTVMKWDARSPDLGSVAATN